MYPPVNKNPLAPTADSVLAERNAAPGFSAPGPQRGKARKRQSKGGFAEAATAVHRTNVTERMGSRLRITVNLPGPQGEAAHTQANGRIIRSTPSYGGNFWEEGRY